MNLQNIVTTLLNDSKQTTPRGLGTIAEAEKYLQQAYEGRYFFELIQNVRDANKMVNQDGSIFIELKGNVLTICNTGQPFTEQGIESITTIGNSPKQSQDLIGFKGIGFKSVQEVTREPRIITQFGSIAFNRKLTSELYNNKLPDEKIPLFYFPHFQTEALSDEEIQLGIVTRIELPLKEKLSEELILADFEKIHARQLVMLGNISQLTFTSEILDKSFQIRREPSSQIIEVIKDKTQSFKFKSFVPESPISIPARVIDSLEGKEKEIFLNSPKVDLNIVLKLNSHGRVLLMKDANLYLFYPLQIVSGFRFMIHSYFIVNPERKELRDSPLNTFLLTEIGKFIGTTVLKFLKANHHNSTQILAFKRTPFSKLDSLYNQIVNSLRTEKFIFESQSQKYYSVDEVVIADKFDKGLFPDGKLGDRHLVYIEDQETITWIRQEFSVLYLTYTHITDEIEKECRHQVDVKNIKFFQNLYDYIGKHPNLNLTGKKVLLTDRWALVASDEDVLYGGRKYPLRLPDSIVPYIHLIHPGIKIPDIREGKSRTGILEFSTYELVRRLLKLFAKNDVPKRDILNVLFSLELDVKSEQEIKHKVMLPIVGSNDWLAPMFSPIYFEHEKIRELYPDGYYVDENVVNSEKPNSAVRQFLKKCGVWDIPAVYVLKERSVISPVEYRDKKLQSYTSLYSRPYSFINDRVFQEPVRYTSWFTDKIIENWSLYTSFICSDSLPPLNYVSAQSSSVRSATNKEMVLQLSGFMEVLKTKNWIVLSGEETAFKVSEIIGVEPHELSQPHNQVIKRYLKVLPMPYANRREMMQEIGMIHLDGETLANYTTLLDRIYQHYSKLDCSFKDFTDFYNRLIGKLFEFYYFRKQQTVDVTPLKEIYFLGVNELTHQNQWSQAKTLYYLDDKPGYDLLPISIKQQIQPHFTNRDKNTFGKIASKIGKKFSTSIQKQLVDEEPIRTHQLINFFPALAQYIALLEFSLDTVLGGELDQLRKIKVLEKKSISIQVVVNNDIQTEVILTHFVDSKSDFDLHVIESQVEPRRIYADAISELFAELLERDLKRFNFELFQLMSNPDTQALLRGYDISEGRIADIQNRLNASDLSNEQKFWDALLSCKGVNDRSAFSQNNTDIYKLVTLLEINAADIHQFQKAYDFNEPSLSSNIEPLQKILSCLSLTLSNINEYIFPKIDFRNFYNKQLVQIKNKFQRAFEAELHDYLTMRPRADQETYQDQLDSYKIQFNCVLENTILSTSVTDVFLMAINQCYSFKQFEERHLTSEYGSFNPTEIYKQQEEKLITLLDKFEIDRELLGKFFTRNSTRSLLYFNQSTYLAELFKSFQKASIPTEKQPIQDNLEVMLSQFSSTTKEIEPLVPQRVNVTETGPGNGTSKRRRGSRVDGESNEENKKLSGIVAEMVVYEILKKNFHEVSWVSKNASKIPKSHKGYNPEGDDQLGYDIEYLDADNNKHFVEVKGRMDGSQSFEITRLELRKAHESRTYYRVIFVTHTLDNIKRLIRDLGPIFHFAQGEDFFNNPRFTPVYKNFEIRFK